MNMTEKFTRKAKYYSQVTEQFPGKYMYSMCPRWQKLAISKKQTTYRLYASTYFSFFDMVWERSNKKWQGDKHQA